MTDEPARTAASLHPFRRVVVVAVVVAAVVGGAGLVRNFSWEGGYDEGALVLENRSSQRLRVLYELPDGEVELANIAVKGKVALHDFRRERGCTVAPLVARTVNGSDVARRSPPLCAGDSWVLRDEDLSTER